MIGWIAFCPDVTFVVPWALHINNLSISRAIKQGRQYRSKRDFATPHSHHTFSVFVLVYLNFCIVSYATSGEKYFEFSSGFHHNINTLIIVLPLRSFLAACVKKHCWTQQPVKESFHWIENTLFMRDLNYKRLSLKDSPSILHGINFISQTVITELTE